MGVRLILDAVLGARRATQHSRFRRSEGDDLPRQKRQQAERAPQRPLLPGSRRRFDPKGSGITASNSRRSVARQVALEIEYL